MSTHATAALIDSTIAGLAPLVRADYPSGPVGERRTAATLASMTASLHQQITDWSGTAGDPEPLTADDIADHFAETYTVAFTGRRPDGTAPASLGV